MQKSFRLLSEVTIIDCGEFREERDVLVSGRYVC